MLCEAEHRNPNLKLFSLFDNPPNFEVFAKIFECTCVHPCPFTGSAPCVADGEDKAQAIANSKQDEEGSISDQLLYYHHMELDCHIDCAISLCYLQPLASKVNVLSGNHFVSFILLFGAPSTIIYCNKLR